MILGVQRTDRCQWKLGSLTACGIFTWCPVSVFFDHCLLSTTCWPLTDGKYSADRVLRLPRWSALPCELSVFYKVKICFWLVKKLLILDVWIDAIVSAKQFVPGPVFAPSFRLQYMYVIIILTCMVFRSGSKTTCAIRMRPKSMWSTCAVAVVTHMQKNFVLCFVCLIKMKLEVTADRGYFCSFT